MDKYVEPKKNAIHVTVLHNVTNKYQQAYVSAIAPTKLCPIAPTAAVFLSPHLALAP